ncbi:hypothetical protein [Croceiramulus getboli]|nr:hypothetical protein P8624_11625 [Flavobacteriaceae bacterium YJPT1-3]
MYEAFPDIKIWKTAFFTYDSNYYGSVAVVAWTLFGKVIPLLFLFIWFFTCRHWWYHAILVPIVMYSFQIGIIFNDDLSFVDGTEFLFMAPIILIVAIFAYTVRTKVFDVIHGIDLSELGRTTITGELQKEDPNAPIILNADDDDEDTSGLEQEEPLFMG